MRDRQASKDGRNEEGDLLLPLWNVGRAKMQSSGSMHRAMADVSVAVSFSLDHK